MGVSTGTIVGWESGKFKPRGKKGAELADLEKWDKADAERPLEGKAIRSAIPDKAEGEKPTVIPQVETIEEPIKGRGKRRVSRKKVGKKGKRS